VTQWLVEEAAFAALEEMETSARIKAHEELEREQRLREGALRALGRHQP
jgi:hypothetical protein